MPFVCFGKYAILTIFNIFGHTVDGNSETINNERGDGAQNHSVSLARHETPKLHDCFYFHFIENE